LYFNGSFLAGSHWCRECFQINPLCFVCLRLALLIFPLFFKLLNQTRTFHMIVNGSMLLDYYFLTLHPSNQYFLEVFAKFLSLIFYFLDFRKKMVWFYLLSSHFSGFRFEKVQKHWGEMYKATMFLQARIKLIVW
jgi:hypothetical protein